MSKDSHAPDERTPLGRTHPEDEAGPQVDKGGTQGIVRDQRGQEQPADKERAQRVSKSE